jgi:hypothetical protein
MVGAEGFEPPTLCSQSRSRKLWKSVENICFRLTVLEPIVSGC